MTIYRLPLVLLLGALALKAQTDTEPLTARERMLLERVEKLEQRLALLEGKAGGSGTNATTPAVPTAAAPTEAPQTASAPAPDSQHTTLNFVFDGYYGENFNRPIGRDNLLRAYDVTSNNFSLSQAAMVLENAPDPDHGKRYGARLDLQFGQATETLQGKAANEPRPEIYRAIFQAYGTYVFQVGKGLTVDFGKFASSLGVEGNYTKDQMNYSRSYWFNFLPSYHTGVRVRYQVNDLLGVNYWTVNGTQQTESFNNFKDQFVGLVIQPNKKVSWNVNYYLGQEHPDTVYFPNGVAANAPANLPELQGVPFEPISRAAQGKLHIFDSYITWQTTPKLSVALEGDYVLERLNSNSAPEHTSGVSGYGKYQLTPKLAIAGRGEYLSDRGGLFSGATQALKETTFTAEYKIAEGFLIREEWRRDFSNQRYFLTDTLGPLKKEQNTATMGLIWWFGPKTGIW